MRTRPVKTHKITIDDNSIFDILDKYITDLKEKSIVVITSKIIAITQGRVKEFGSIDKDELIKSEAEFYLPRSSSKYNFLLTIANNILMASAGIDESNGNGFYILWPENLQETANSIRDYLKEKFKLKEIGVIITDSRTTPLRMGTNGISLAYSGFKAIKNYIHTEDLFGRELKVTKANIVDGLAVSAVLVMGEGRECTPIAMISELDFIEFQDRNPTEDELKELTISIEDDLYAPLLTAVKWEKGSK